MCRRRVACLVQTSLLFSCLLLLVEDSFSAPRRPELLPGADKAGVISAWGPPKAKIELGAKNSERWEYGDVTLEFQNGFLMAPNKTPTESKPEQESAAPRAGASQNRVRPLKADEIGEFLKDIQGKEGGAEPAGALPSGASMGFIQPQPNAAGSPFQPNLKAAPSLPFLRQ